MQLYDHLLYRSEVMPDKVAVITEGGEFPYKQVLDGCEGFHNGLMHSKIRKRDRVAIYLENSIESIYSIYGTLRSGGVFVVINPGFKAEKLTYILNHSRSRIIVTDLARSAAVIENVGSLPFLEKIVIVCEGDKECQKNSKVDIVDFISFIELKKGNISPPPVIDADLASIIYTSGSTGVPKGVTLSHLNMETAARSIIEYIGNREGDIILDVLPLAFDYGLYQVIMSMIFGGTVVLERSFTFPHIALTKIERERITGFPVVPAIVSMLSRMKNIEGYDLSSVRYLTNTAQKLSEGQILKLREIFPEASVFSMYGLTECKRVSYLKPELIDIKPNSVGKAMPNVEVFIVDEERNRVDAPDFVGELVVRGSNIMVGYWDDEEETKKKIGPGFFPGDRILFTGDLFRMDEDGDLYFMGRKDEMLKVLGERIYPKEIENVLLAVESVEEAAVIGRKDENDVDSIIAFVTTSREMEEKDIIGYCIDHMERRIVPKKVIILDEMPLSENGKIDKRRLMDL